MTDATAAYRARVAVWMAARDAAGDGWTEVDEVPGARFVGTLDRFEGYPVSYQRRKATVTRTGSRERVAVVLYYKRATAALAPPNPEYIARILRALKRLGAP